MKRYLIAAASAVLVLSLVNADDTGRASIRSADPAPEGHTFIRASETAPAAAPSVVPAGAVFGMVTGSGCGSGCSTCLCGRQDSDPRVGINPIFSRLFWWKKAKCKHCGGLFGPRANSGLGLGLGHGRGQGDGFNPYPNGVPGTLVFPQHPFVRSPRDFWMADPK